MALYKIKDFDPNYRDHDDENDIKGFDLYAGSEKVGAIHDILVDEAGEVRYLVINTGLWIFGKKVLLPIGLARISYTTRRVYADSLTKAQVEALPEYTDDMTVDYAHEEQVRGVYRASSSNPPAAFGVGYAGYETAPSTPNSPPTLDLSAGYSGYDRDSYTYQLDPTLYEINEQNHQGLKLYQERLIASKARQKIDRSGS
jgi:PRC-barrel domain